MYSLDELIKLGTEKPAEPVAPKPDDLCTIMYTSGGGGGVGAGVADRVLCCKDVA